MKKLSSKRGETLVEMLVSIALLVLAMSILSAMLAAAYNSDVAARDMDEKLQEDLKAAEDTEDPSASPHGGTVTIKPDDGSAEVTISVNIYGDKDGLHSYK